MTLCLAWLLLSAKSTLRNSSVIMGPSEGFGAMPFLLRDSRDFANEPFKMGVLAEDSLSSKDGNCLRTWQNSSMFLQKQKTTRKYMNFSSVTFTHFRTYPSDWRTALMKQVLPRLRNPTKFFNASFFELLLLAGVWGAEDDLLLESVLFLAFLFAGWFSTPFTPSTDGDRLFADFFKRSELRREGSSDDGVAEDSCFLIVGVVTALFRDFDSLSSSNAARKRSNFASGVSFTTKSSQA